MMQLIDRCDIVLTVKVLSGLYMYMTIPKSIVI